MKSFIRGNGLFGRLVLALMPTLVVVIAGMGVGGDANQALVIRVAIVLGSLAVFFPLIRIIQGHESRAVMS